MCSKDWEQTLPGYNTFSPFIPYPSLYRPPICLNELMVMPYLKLRISCFRRIRIHLLHCWTKVVKSVPTKVYELPLAYRKKNRFCTCTYTSEDVSSCYTTDMFRGVLYCRSISNTAFYEKLCCLLVSSPTYQLMSLLDWHRILPLCTLMDPQNLSCIVRIRTWYCQEEDIFSLALVSQQTDRN